MAKNHSAVDEKFFSKTRYWFQRFVSEIFLYSYYKIFFDLKINGVENIPKDRAVIIAPNHISHNDPPIIGASIPKTAVFMAKKELFDVPVLSTMISWLSAIAVNRQKLEVSTIRSCKMAIKSNWPLVIFPEGTRSDGEKIGEVKGGFAYLAKTCKADIVPVGIIGSKGKRGKAIVNVGKPISHELEAEDLVDAWAMSIEKLANIKYEKNLSEVEV